MDQGHIKDYFGPYSPYEEDLWPLVMGKVEGNITNGCVHFLACDHCGNKTQRFIKNIWM
ncbi:MAG: hypothetical protein GX318_04835 [Clostridia bacterium]|nr:hypothetical protein [Clostridia bacterium]